MSSLNLTTQLYVDGAWTSYTSLAGEGWSTSIGPDPETGTQPNRLEFTLSDDTFEMDPTNAESSLYGKIGRNTPARIRIDSDTLTVGEAASWRPTRTVEHSPGTGRGLSVMALAAEGLLSRLGRWEDPLDSPLRRQTGSYASLTGYWPLEDPSGSANLAQVVPRVRAATYTGTVSLAGDEGAGGSGPSLVVGTDTRIDGHFAGSSASGWQLCWVMKLAATPGSAAYNTVFAIVDTMGRTWQWQVSNANFQIVVSDAEGTVLETSAVAYGTTPITDWIRYRLKVTVSGATITYEPAWYVQDGSFITGWTDTFAGTSTAQPRDWRITGNSYVDGAAYGHAFVVTDTTLNLAGAGEALAAFNGYLGERAGDRFNRLMGEQGLEHWLSGTAGLSAPMGRQKPARLLDLVEECARSDAALLFDDPVDDTGECRLTLRLNNDLVNRTPARALEYGVDVSPPLAKTIDNVLVANDVTVTNYDGATYRAERTTGTLSTAVPPTGVGRYRRPLAVSLEAPEQVANRANAELAAGTLDRPRYLAVVVDLLRFPSYRATVTAMRPGDWITLAAVEPDPVYLMVMQIQRAGDAIRDTAMFKCIPAEPFMTGEYDDGVVRYDSSSTTVKTAVTNSGTSIVFRTAIVQDIWSTVDEPYDVVISGQRNTVTSMGAAALVSGSYDQTATVTRGVDGVTKALAAGEPIHVARPGRYGLGGF